MDVEAALALEIPTAPQWPTPSLCTQEPDNHVLVYLGDQYMMRAPSVCAFASCPMLRHAVLFDRASVPSFLDSDLGPRLSQILL